MQLLSPAVLFALAALAVPILLHLFYFRRFRRVAFTNVRFLREVKEETQRRSRLRNLLVLALRLLAFAAVVVAFAQPSVGGDPDRVGVPERVSVVVDNSRSMAAQASEVSLLQKAKQRARDIVLAFDESTEFQLLTNDLDGASGRWLTREDALASIDGVGFGESPQDGAQLLSRVLSPGTAEAATAFLISDFQRSQYDLAALSADSTRVPNLVPLAAVETRNVSIDSAHLLTPVQLVGEPIEIAVALTNHGDADAASVRLSAVVDGNTQPFGLREVPANSTVRDTVSLSATRAGWTRAALQITDFPIEFDDRYYVAFEVRPALEVLVISDGPLRPELAAAFPEGGSLRVSANRASNVNYSQLDRYDLVVLDGLRNVPSGLTQRLGQLGRAGGKVVVFPSTSAGAGGGGYGALASALGLPSFGDVEEGDFEGAGLNTRSFVFRDVYERLPRNTRLPRATQRLALRAGDAETLLSFRDGRAFVLAKASGNGIAYASAAPLDGSDLARTPEVFVPMLYRMAFSGGVARPLAQTIGRAGVLAVPLREGLGEAALRLRSAEATLVPPQRRLGQRALLSFGQVVPAPGHYDVVDGADSTLAVVAFNIDRAESPMDFYDETELAASGLPVYEGDDSGVLGAALASGALGTPWWPYLVALALAALAAEACVLRFWRPGERAAVASPRGAAA